MSALRTRSIWLVFVILPVVSSQYSITVYPQILSQNGRTDFEPDRWNGHNGLDGSSIFAGNKNIGSRPGRWLNPDYGFFRSVTQDPHRKGYPNPAYFRDHNVQASLTNWYKQNMQAYGKPTIALETWGKFWPSWMDTSAHGGMVPNNMDAAAEMVVQMLQAVNSSIGSLPYYYEINNEPDWFYPKVKWPTVIQYQKAVAQKVHKTFPHLKLIGPSMMTTILKADADNFKIWKEAQDFMDMSLHNLFAFCFHPYDFLHWKNGKHNFIGTNEVRLTGFVDLLESYAYHKTGKHVPLIATEFGLDIRDHDQAVTTAMTQWAHAFSINSYMFTFLQHRGVFDKVMAFVYGGPQTSFPELILFDAHAHETHIAKAFKFWKHFDNSHRFLRVDSSFNAKERTISSLAVYDKNSNYVTVLLHNYVQSSAVVTVNFNPSWMRPTSADMTCMYLASNNVPTLDTHHVAIHDGKVNLKPESSCFIRFHTTYNFHIAPTYHEKTVYAKDMVIHIAGNAVQTTVSLPNIHNALSVVLRIGVSNSNKAAHTAPTQVHVNSATISTQHVFWLYGRDEPFTPTKWNVYNYNIPTHAIRSGSNTVNLHFAQSGGYVSSVAIIIGTISGN